MQWQQSQAWGVGWWGEGPVREVGAKDWMSGEERKGEMGVLKFGGDIVLLWWVLVVDGFDDGEDEVLGG